MEEAPVPIITSSGEEIIYKEFYNYGDYYVKLCINKEELSIVCYNMDKLDGIRYETKTNLQKIYNINSIFRQYTNIKDIYELLLDLLKEHNCNLELNPQKNLVLSFTITDIRRNSIKIQLILNNNEDNNTKEYINILSNEIKNLRNNNNKEIKELKEEIQKIKDMISNNNNNNSKKSTKKSCIYCGNEMNLKKCICCNKIICDNCFTKNEQCEKECFLFNNNLNTLTSYYQISKYPLPKNFEVKIHFTGVDYIRTGITFEPNIINESDYDLNCPGYNIYYILKDAKRFYTYDKGWFGYFKSEKGFEKGDDLIIKIKEGKIYYYINGESLGDPYPIKKSDIDSKNMYLLIHRRDKNSNCELKYLYEIFD